MKINTDLNKDNLLIILHSIVFSSDMRIDCYENGLPFCFEIKVAENQYFLSRLLDKASMEEIKDWHKIDITFQLFDAMDALQIDIYFDKEKEVFKIVDKTSHL